MKTSNKNTQDEVLRTERLHELMETYQLKAQDVGDVLGVSAHTVRTWRCKFPARVITAKDLRLLELEIADRSSKGEK